jgi:hypothetical protein
MQLKFVTGEPAMLYGKSLILSDLHIGIEHRYRKDGINIPSQSGNLLDRIGKLVKETRARKLIILGDIKHRVPGTSFQEERDIPLFFSKLLDIAGVEVTPGNHDDRIGRLLPSGVKLHHSTGFMLGNLWLCHGHAWPGMGFLDAESIVMGHNHASVEFRDKLGYRWTNPVWIRAEIDRKKLVERYEEIPAKKAIPELILIPPFNGFAGLIPMNRPDRVIRKHFREGPNPMFRISKKRKAKVYMLDGTFLGELGKL